MSRSILTAVLTLTAWLTPCPPACAEGATDKARSVFEAGGGALGVDERDVVVPGAEAETEALQIDGAGIEFWIEKYVGGRLQAKLERWAGNTLASYATGGEIESYGFVIDPSRPGVVDVTVSHYPSSRRMVLLPSRRLGSE